LQSLANSIGSKCPVDVVVAWVDGRDRKHRAKRRRYLADPGGDTKPERVAVSAQRFSDNDEIRYCLRSIHNYAPWVRTVWLVTDDQVPASVARRRAERYNIRIVDHREIFRGMSNCPRSTHWPSKRCCGGLRVWPIASSTSRTT